MKHKFSVSLSLALVLALVVATFALADNFRTDGDGLSPVVDTPSLDLGNVCLGSTTSKSILHAVSRNGNYPNPQVFTKGTNVGVFVNTPPGSGLSASGGGTILLPVNWDTVDNNTLSETVSSSVTFVASALGPFSGTVNYNASGTDSKNDNSLSLTDSLTVSATVVNCDTTAPTLSLPDDMIVEATGASGAVVSFSATATDADPLNPFVTCDPASGSTFPLDVTTIVDCSATDAAGNTANGNFDITVVDTTPPTVTPPSNIIAEAADGSGAVVSYSGESALDIVDGDVAVSCTPASGSTFTLGSNLVTCLSTDSHNNIGTNTFTIDVQDTTAPILALPGDITEEATGSSGATVNFSASASDLVDGPVAVSCDWNDGDIFPLGTTLVSCSATDSNNNTSNGAFNITVVDTIAPTLTLPSNFSVEATSSAGADATFTASAFDIVDGDVAVSCTPASGSIFPLGATQVDCSATDAAGNSANGNFSVTVVDTTPPSLTLPADQQLEANGPSGAVATFSASATDLVDGPLTVSCDATSGDTFPLGTTTVNCSVSDAAGNPASGSFVIIVEDTTNPVITFVSHTDTNSNGWNNGEVTVNWSCSDTVGVVSATLSEMVSTEGANQSTTGTCEDTSGNTASDTQSGINIDKTQPFASASRTPGANSFGWNNSNVTVAFDGVDALSGIDFCSADQVFGEGENQSASGTCTDLAGNVSEPATVSDINVDKTAPTISGAPDRSANANNWYNADVTVSFSCYDALSGVDFCSEASALGEGTGQSVPGSVTDKAGNSANTTVSDINIDKTDPVITAALDKTPEIVSGWFNISTGAPTVGFVCSDTLSGLNGACPAGHTFGNGANQSYSQTIFDLAGNSASDGVSDVDVDTVAPSISAFLSPDRLEGGWWNIASGAPTVSFTCSDGISGVMTCPAAHTFGEGQNQALSGTVIDHAGNHASTSVYDIDVDLTAPSISATLDRSPADSGWFNASTGVPKVVFACSDAGPSTLEFCPSEFTFDEGEDLSHQGTAHDFAGNSTSAGVSDVDVDLTGPVVTASRIPAANDFGWNNTDVEVIFLGTDSVSGTNYCFGANLTAEGEDQSVTGTCYDHAGNAGNSVIVSDINIDKTDPSITWNGGPTDGGVYYFGFVPAEPSCTASDSLSGPNGCTVAGYGNGIGSYSMTATALDKADNQTVETHNYTVSAWTLNGFYQPVDMNGVYNTVKNGSTVPLKFEMFAGPTELTDIAYVQSLTYAQTTCNTTAVTDEIETIATGGTVLRYDTTGGQFIFNWKTPNGTAGKCFRVTMTADDGNSLVAYFRMK